MAWTYFNWVVCNVLVGFGIVLLTSLILGIFLLYSDSIFYGLVGKLFNIERCIMNVHHEIIRNNSEMLAPNASTMKCPRFFSNLCYCCTKAGVENSATCENITALASGNISPKVNHSEV